jgi:hypothetical protein
LPASASSACNSTSACVNAPRADHSSNRRRQVSPLGNPNSRYGTSSHGVSVYSTNKIPSKHARAG